jgi:CBS domain-containing protein/sporulation protein YlmC with PRC-barrel domain
MDKIKVLNEFFFSQIRAIPIFDHDGRKVGNLRDLAISWENEQPRVTGIKYAKNVQKHIPVQQIANISAKGVELSGRFEESSLIPLKPNEIYMGKWLMDKQIIDLKGSKVVRVNDIRLFWLQRNGMRYLVPAAVDIGLRGLARRLGVECLLRRTANHFVRWQSIQHLEEKTAALKLLSEKQQLDQLHPADLADLIEDLDYRTRSDLIEELDAETAAEAVAEMELDTQVEIIEHLGRQQAVDILQEMPVDEAADLLGEMSEEKSDELLKLMEPEDAQEVRDLMSYEEETAGALMTTEYIALPPEITAAEAIVRLRQLAAAAETIYYLYIQSKQEKLMGVVSLRELLIADPETTLEDVMQDRLIFVHPEDDHEKIAELLNKYGLLAIPVLAKNNKMLGIITVDDVLEILLPDRSSLETFSHFFISKRSARG